MPDTYTPVGANITAGTKPTLTVPLDDDPRNASTVVTPLSKLADFAEYLIEQQLAYQASNFPTRVQIASGTQAIFRLMRYDFASTGITGLVAMGYDPGAASVGKVWRSYDMGRSWASIDPGGAAWTIMDGVAIGSGLAVFVGSGGQIRTVNNINTASPTWTVRTSGTTDPLNGVAYNGTNLFVAVGNNGRILSSPDGITWTSRATSAGVTYNTIEFVNGLWVAAGIKTGGFIATSADGVTWTTRYDASGVAELKSVAYNAALGLYCAAGTGASSAGPGFLTSSDGVTWTVAYSATGLSYSLSAQVVSTPRGFVAPCDGSTVIAYSPDGVIWRTWAVHLNVTNGMAPRAMHAILFQDALYVVDSQYLWAGPQMPAR